MKNQFNLTFAISCFGIILNKLNIVYIVLKTDETFMLGNQTQKRRKISLNPSLQKRGVIGNYKGGRIKKKGF